MDESPLEQTEQQFLDAVRASRHSVVDAVGAWAKLEAAAPAFSEQRRVTDEG